MGGLYLVDLADRLRAAGLHVVELDGWQTRARSSGGYDDAGPWAVFWHHTASGGDGAADADYCTFGSPDRPVCNVVVGRDGIVHVCAAGGTNTNGKGGPLTLPGGRTIPLDGANSRVFGIELSSDGVGMTYPVAQLDAAMVVSLTVAGYGIRPDDVVTHYVWAPTRKIDPATADAVQGPWQPAASTSSGTWALDDLRAELVARAGTPPPPPTLEDDMARYLVQHPGPGPHAGAWVLTDTATYATPVPYPGSDKALADLLHDGTVLFAWQGDGDGPWLLGPQWGPLLDDLIG